MFQRSTDGKDEMNRHTIAFLSAFAAAGAAFAASAHRDVIVIGWEFMYTPPSEIAKHAESYRGIGISGADFTLFGRVPDGTRAGAASMPADYAWKRSDFAEDEAALRSLAKMPEFSRSFIAAARCPRKRIPWDDDGAWKRYAENVRVFASIAHDVGIAGISMDNEDYAQSKQFRLCDGDGSYDAAAKLARRRGRDVFAAVFEAFPSARVHFDRFYTQDLWDYYAANDSPREYARVRGDLWVPFLDGALEALGPGGVYYEGDETGYRYAADNGDAAEARSRNQIDLARLVDPALREKYRSQVRLALPVYLDRYTQTNPKSRYWANPDSGSRMARFERDFAAARAASDDYVWMYAEQRTLAAWKRPAGFFKGVDGGFSSWEESMPGFGLVLSFNKDPISFGREVIDRLSARGAQTELVPPNFRDGPLPAPVQSWQAKTQPGLFGAKSGTFFAEGVGRGGISYTAVDVREGDLYAIDFEVRGEIGYTLVRFHRKGAVADLTFPPTEMYAPPAGDTDDWRRFSRTVRVPRNVENMLVSIGVSQKPGERANVRKFAVKRIARFDAMPEAPFEVEAKGRGFCEKLVQTGSKWIGANAMVELVPSQEGAKVCVSAPNAQLEEIRIRWRDSIGEGDKVFLDTFSGSWRSLGKGGESMWYFLHDNGVRTDGWGVKTRPAAFVCWKVRKDVVEGVFDMRAGGRPLRLGSRVLEAATVIRREGLPGETAFTAGRAFARLMCPSPRLVREPVYGYNDWYCAYGANTATNFLADAKYVSSLAKGLRARPYAVIDDGWQENSPPEIKRKTGVFDSGCGPWEKEGDKFGMDMKTFAGKISALGAKPGLWYRPLRAWEGSADGMRCSSDRRFFDPTDPEVIKRIEGDIARFRDWGFKLVKVDYLTYDLIRDYMHNIADFTRIADESVQWRDDARTTAEVIGDLYAAIRKAAGDGVVIIGCNAIGHLAAGVFEIQRTGRDTSGWSWDKTAECGVNAIGRRGFLDRIFYAADPDCVGLAEAGAIPWERNSDWLELISRAKAPLFISWKRSLATDVVRAAFRRAFERVTSPGAVGEPLDWQSEALPRRWKFADGEREFDWYPAGDAANSPVRKTLEEFVAKKRIAGAVSALVSPKGEVRFDCVGYADVDSGRRMTPDTVFAIFSMTKIFTGAAIMCAIDDGKMSLDDPVSKFLPEFADVKMSDGSAPSRQLTIRDLMSHVAGFRNSRSAVNRDAPLRQVARELAAMRLAAQPGATFKYGNSWICAAAACLEIAVGKPYEDYLDERILKPLGMEETTFWPGPYMYNRIATAYTTDDKPLRIASDRCTPQLEFPKKTKIYPAASGGLFSTPRDMARFGEMLAHHGEWRGKKIISRDTFDGVFAVKQTPDGIKERYTVGSWIENDWFGHEGAMRTDLRANLRTGWSRLFFIQTNNAAGSAFQALKNAWNWATEKEMAGK